VRSRRGAALDSWQLKLLGGRARGRRRANAAAGGADGHRPGVLVKPPSSRPRGVALFPVRRPAACPSGRGRNRSGLTGPRLCLKWDPGPTGPYLGVGIPGHSRLGAHLEDKHDRWAGEGNRAKTMRKEQTPALERLRQEGDGGRGGGASWEAASPPLCSDGALLRGKLFSPVLQMGHAVVHLLGQAGSNGDRRRGAGAGGRLRTTRPGPRHGR